METKNSVFANPEVEKMLLKGTPFGNWESLSEHIGDNPGSLEYTGADRDQAFAYREDRFLYAELLAIDLASATLPVIEAAALNEPWLFLVAVASVFLIHFDPDMRLRWRICIAALITSLLYAVTADFAVGACALIGFTVVLLLRELWLDHANSQYRKALKDPVVFFDLWSTGNVTVIKDGAKHKCSYEAKKAIEEYRAGTNDLSDVMEATIRENERLNFYNNEFKKRFSQWRNPITGKPIATAQDYLIALYAQNKGVRIEENRELSVPELNEAFKSLFGHIQGYNGKPIENMDDYLINLDIQTREKERNAHVEESRPQTNTIIQNPPEPAKPENTSEDTRDYFAELDELIGLEEIKQDVRELINLVKMQKYRQEHGLSYVPVSKHLVFTGNPGTGKTTVARILGGIYREIGVLPKGHVVEVDRSGLVGGYIGHTALKTQEKIKEAQGGILFIDEAYTLAKDRNDFGPEAIDTILKAMEDRRDEFVVIVAGYPDRMKTFIESNPGLQSRFNKYFFFKDYTEEELCTIFRSMCSKYDYILSPQADTIIEWAIARIVHTKTRNFANAREIRNLFERVISNQASRVMCEKKSSAEAMVTITKDDILRELDV